MSNVIRQRGIRFERLPGMSEDVVTVLIDGERQWFEVGVDSMEPLPDDLIQGEQATIIHVLWEEVQRLRDQLGVVVDDD